MDTVVTVVTHVGTLDEYIKYAISVALTMGFAWVHRRWSLKKMKKNGKIQD